MGTARGWVRAGLCATMAGLAVHAQGQSQADVDEARRRADYFDQLKREAEAKKAIADADAAAAASAANAQSAKTKVEADADKAKVDYYKSLLPTPPDPSKYKIAAPTAPKVAATAANLVFVEADALSAEVTTAVVAAIKQPLCVAQAAAVAPAAAPAAKPGVAIVPDDPKTRTLIAVSRATRAALDAATTRLERERKALAAETAKPPGGGGALAVPVLPLVSSLLETAVSFASILRTQYGFETTSETALAESVFQAKVYQRLVGNACIQVLDPDAILTLVPAGGPNPPELVALEKLAAELRDSRAQARLATDRAGELRDTAPKPADEKNKATAAKRDAYLQQANSLDARVKSLTAFADETDKSVAALYAVDAQGSSPIDAAIRGGKLSDAMSGKAAYTLALKATSSDVDTIAADGLFRGLRVGVASNTVVRWRLTDSNGMVVSVGSVQHASPLKRIALD